MTPLTAPPQPEKKISGCLIALLIVGSLVALSCAVGGFFVWRATQSEKGKMIFGAMGKGLDLLAKAKKAPGTAELRAAGCREAMVTDPREMLHAFEGVFDAGTTTPRDEGGMTLMVACEPGGERLECDRLAEIFVSAAKPDIGFNLIVSRAGSPDNKPDCAKKYDAAGKPTE